MKQKRLLHHVMKRYLRYVSETYYRDITMINEDQVPLQGPVIIFGNHNNLFLDGGIFIAHPPRLVYAIAAALSCKKPIVGPIMLKAGCIPVERPIDKPTDGKGKIIKIQNYVVTGRDTNFLSLQTGQAIELVQNRLELYIKEIISDTQMIISTSTPDSDQEFSYKALARVGFEFIYKSIWQGLAKGVCIAIYPQGKSKDTLELLSLKAGICIMALGAMEKYNVSVKLVPFYLTFYRPDEFRSKFLMEYGPTYEIPQEIIDLYRRDKFQAVNLLLKHVQTMLRDLMIDFPHYDDTQTMYHLKELYVLASNRKISPKQEVQLNRRFARGYNLLMNIPQYSGLRQRLLTFTSFVIKHKILLEAANVKKSKFFSATLAIAHTIKIGILSALALPAYVIYLPLTKVSQILAQKQRKKNVKPHQHKDRRKDVVASYVCIFCAVFMPVSAAVASSLLFYILKKWTKFSTKMRLVLSLLFFLLQPLYGRLYVNLYDSIKRSWGKLKLLLWSIFRSREYSDFVRQKQDLQRDIVKCVNKFGSEVVKDFDKKRIIKHQDIRKELQEGTFNKISS